MQSANVRNDSRNARHVFDPASQERPTPPRIRDEITQVHELEPTPAGPHSVALHIHNTASAAQLFIRAAFAGLPPSFRRGDHADPWTPSLFALGGIDAAVELGHLSEWARARIERLFLRDRFGIGLIASLRLQRALRARALTPMGQEIAAAGRRALVEWLHGDDPSWRLQQLMRSHADPPRARYVGRRTRPQHPLH